MVSKSRVWNYIPPDTVMRREHQIMMGSHGLDIKVWRVLLGIQKLSNVFTPHPPQIIDTIDGLKYLKWSDNFSCEIYLR